MVQPESLNGAANGPDSGFLAGGNKVRKVSFPSDFGKPRPFIPMLRVNIGTGKVELDRVTEVIENSHISRVNRNRPEGVKH